MYDPLSLFKLWLALWAFIKEHLLKNKKIMKHFQHNSIEFMLFVVQAVIIGLLINLGAGVWTFYASHRDLETRATSLETLLSQQTNELLEKERKITDVTKELLRKENEVLFLRELLKKSAPGRINSEPSAL